MIHWPTHAPRRITQFWGENANSVLYGYGPAGHLGVDLVADDWTIYAPMSGTVRTLKDTGYGNWILLTGIDGWTTRLAHMSKFLIPDHSEVTAGDPVGVAGRGLYVIYVPGDAATCIAVRNANDTLILSDGLNVFRTTDTDGFNCLLSAAGQPFTIKNRRGSTRTYWVHHLGFPTA